ncbi:hypothetical protein GH810_02205 [Acetobacterium paludosum]|uniref:Gram-positive cocci surface proteins LPxTG domain-containing protein n=1 Tax=Acetobacterium paludosum TaxID=52693 RepID=A0A923KWB8_9FIRM|nr:SpaA isopeptide-forming pilin-related protein [Acetobacterium paludosum]MBC3887121.1 hypothetical protein [Acetobacterium paludosum]
MKIYTNKIIGLLYFVVFLLAASAALTALAEGVTTIPNDLTGQSQYLVIHEATGDYTNTGGNSSITVTKPDGTAEIAPTVTNGNLTYSNIPAGDKIAINYAFHLVDGDESSGNAYTYSGSNFFTVTLPEGITFIDPGTDNKIMASDNTDPNNPVVWQMGTWSISGNIVRVDFDETVANHNNMWLAIRIDGTFDALSDGDTGTTSMNLGDQTITFTREQPSTATFTLEKSGVYDAATNQITWTVTAGPDTIDLSGYTLLDTFSNNQTYVSNSFTAGNIGNQGHGNNGNSGSNNVNDNALIIDSTAPSISYTFPNSTTGTQTITYKTSPTSFANEDGTDDGNESSTFTNTANLTKDGNKVTEPAHAAVEVNWIDKSADNSAPYGATDGTIRKWTVTVTVPENGTITGAQIVDTLPDGLTLFADDTTYPVQIQFNDDTVATVSQGTDPGTYTYSDSNRKLTYRFPTEQLNGTATLTYYTRLPVRDGYLNSNDPILFTNNAQLIWNENPNKSTPPSDKAAVGAGVGGLIFKYSDGEPTYDHTKTNFIHWIIRVNTNNVTMPAESSVTDTIPVGQKLVIDGTHPFTVKKGYSQNFQATSTLSGSGSSSDTGFTYTLSANEFTDTYTIDYYTQITDPNSLYQNAFVAFENSVALNRGETSTAITGNKIFDSQLLAKTPLGDYNYADHTAKWQIVVNRNQLPLTNTLLTDTLPEGMELQIDDAHPFQILKLRDTTPTTGIPTISSDKKTFTYDFAGIKDADGKIDTQYTITFYTKLLDSALISQWTTAKPFQNNAKLEANEILTPVSASANVMINNPILTKSHSYDVNNPSNHIDWTAVLNKAGLDLKDAVVTDVLDPGLQLDTNSLKLYEATINSDGTVTKSDQLVDSQSYTVDWPTADNNNTLKVNLPAGKHAYYLDFTTNILTDDLSFANKITLTGAANSPTGDATAGKIVITDLFSKGGSNSNKLTVYKDDGNGKAVAGATYQLLNVNQQPIMKSGNIVTTVTDKDGNAVFDQLPSWVFYIKEIAAPVGYLLNPDIIGGGAPLIGQKTVKTSDKLANVPIPPVVEPHGSIELLKTDTNGAPLSGAEFGLYDAAGTLVKTAVSNDEGLVHFAEVPYGSYTIKEVTAPTGYTLSDAAATASVTADNLNVKGNPYTVVNTRSTSPILSGSIELKKTDVNFNPLFGAEFGLYDAAGTLVKTAVSNDEGLVHFAEVPYGSYTIKEVTAPSGYMLSDTESKATVSAERTEVKASPYTIVNYDDINSLQHGIIQVIKVDAQSKVQLPGAVFTLYNESGAVVQTSTSDSSGFATFATVTPGSYSIRETTPPAGYLLSNEVISLSTEVNKTYEYTYANTAATVIPAGNSTGNDSPNDKTSGSSQTGIQKNALPQTGGFWDATTLGLVGAALVVLGIVLNYLNRKKQKNEKKA